LIYNGGIMKEAIKQYIIENIIREKVEIDLNISLLDEGIIDSLGYLKLISFLEKQYDISIDLGEIDIENFDTIIKIAKFVENKLDK